MAGNTWTLSTELGQLTLLYANIKINILNVHSLSPSATSSLDPYHYICNTFLSDSRTFGPLLGGGIGLYSETLGKNEKCPDVSFFP